jgi:hypothetical protein
MVQSTWDQGLEGVAWAGPRQTAVMFQPGLYHNVSPNLMQHKNELDVTAYCKPSYAEQPRRLMLMTSPLSCVGYTVINVGCGGARV